MPDLAPLAEPVIMATRSSANRLRSRWRSSRRRPLFGVFGIVLVPRPGSIFLCISTSWSLNSSLNWDTKKVAQRLHFCYYRPYIRICARSSVVEHSSDKGKVEGSIPSARTKDRNTCSAAGFLLLCGPERCPTSLRDREAGSWNFAANEPQNIPDHT